MALLNRLFRASEFALPAFETLPLEFEPEADELVLDSIVAGIGPESRVVRLVQPMPTAGELQARIDDHLRGPVDVEPVVDAAEELRIALAELRQSLA